MVEIPTIKSNILPLSEKSVQSLITGIFKIYEDRGENHGLQSSLLVAFVRRPRAEARGAAL